MPDFVLEGSVGTPFEGNYDAYVELLSFRHCPTPVSMLPYYLIYNIVFTLFSPEGGYYYGKLKFPSDYPFKPPSIRY
jgi:hypothetical protein